MANSAGVRASWLHPLEQAIVHHLREPASELGIPAVKIGPRGRNVGGRVEEIEIDDLVKAAKLYALVALDMSSRTRPSGNARAR